VREHHDYVDDEHCYGCRLKAKTFRLSATATPSRQNLVRPATANPVWENTTTGTYRNDGSFMPNISADLSRQIKVKEYAENRSAFEALRRKRANDPTPERV
jgi:hypothetical protein